MDKKDSEEAVLGGLCEGRGLTCECILKDCLEVFCGFNFQA